MPSLDRAELAVERAHLGVGEDDVGAGRPPDDHGVDVDDDLDAPGSSRPPPETIQCRTRVRVSGIGRCAECSNRALGSVGPGGQRSPLGPGGEASPPRPRCGRSGDQGGRAGVPPPAPPFAGMRRFFASGSLVSALHRVGYLRQGVPLSRQTIPTFACSLAASVVATAVACSSGSSTSLHSTAPVASSADSGPAMPFQADPPSVYVAKVKDILVGLPPTDEEIGAVEADPTQLGTLVDGWMKLPQYDQKMLRFFELAFQQTQVTSTDFADQAYPQQIGVNTTTIPLLTQNAQQSFARTMQELLSQGAPLTAGMTTQQVMMTTAMKELYTFLDAWEVDDNGTVTDHFKAAYPKTTITVEASQGPIPVTESVDPSSPNFMHWYDPDVTTAGSQIAGCQVDPITYAPSAIALHYLLYGSLDNRKAASGAACGVLGGSAMAPQLQSGDFTDWTMVTIRPPASGETVTQFWNLPTLRTASELVLQIPRVGFFSTPAFFANWQTNTSNQTRVTTHQALIVGDGIVGRRHRHDVSAGRPRPRRDPLEPGRLLRVPQDPRPDPLDLLGDLLVELSLAARPDLDRAAGDLRLPRRHPAGPQHDRLRERAGQPPAVRLGVDAEALLLRQLGALRAVGSAGARRGVPELRVLLERAGQGARDVSRHDEHRADGDRRRQRRGRRGRRAATTCAPRSTRAWASRTCAVCRRRPQRSWSRRSPRSSRACRRTPTGAAHPCRSCRTSRRSSSAPATENICEAIAAQVIDAQGHSARGRDAVEQRAARRGDRRLREPGDGPLVVRSAIGAGHGAAPVALRVRDEADGHHRHRRAAVDVRRRVPGAVGRLDRNVT